LIQNDRNVNEHKVVKPFIYRGLNTLKLIQEVMRKLILELEPNEMIREVQKPIFENIYSYEVLEMLKIDWEEGIKIDLIECVTKGDRPIQDVKTIGPMEILNVLKSEGNKHICLVKYLEPDSTKDLVKEFNLDLIWTTPMFFSEKKQTFSCIGEQEDILKFIELIKKVGKIENMTFQKAVYQKHEILSVLTEKQREILITANQYGYYDYPRKITSEQLSRKVNISKPTLVQHLRKAEGRIMANILAGYKSK
jgi:predicted DNA binding protein